MTNKFIYTDNIGYVKLIDTMQIDPMLKTISSAKISYNKGAESFGPKEAKLIGFLQNEEHTSPFRHSVFTFELKVPLFVFRQWVKYQVGCAWREYTVNGKDISDSVYLEICDLQFDTDKGCTWNELSARYAELQDEFYIPEKMRTNAGHANKQASSEPVSWVPEFHMDQRQKLIGLCNTMYAQYKHLLELGIAREIAISYLPMAIYSKSYWTASFQAILHFLDQRLDPNAQFEIRMAANAIKDLVNGHLKLKFPEQNINIDNLLKNAKV